MRYCTWKLTWIDGYGYGPEETAAANGGRLEASSWVSPDVTGTILGYLTGEVDLSALTAWEVTELTEAEALAFAQAINADAFVGETGVISVPAPEPSPGRSPR